MTLLIQCMNRNLRCSLAYLGYRLDKIAKYSWESGKNLPEHLLEKLSPAELNYFQKYLENLESYNKTVSEQLAQETELVDDDARNLASYMPSALDLTVDFAPPKDLFIEVRVNKDYGPVMLPESGEVRL